jgi:hypothetical protein
VGATVRAEYGSKFRQWPTTSRPRGRNRRTVNPSAYAYAGSNPAPATQQEGPLTWDYPRSGVLHLCPAGRHPRRVLLTGRRRRSTSGNSSSGWLSRTARRPFMRTPTRAIEWCRCRRSCGPPGGDDPHPRRQPRRHVHPRLALGDRAPRDVAADPLASLDRPDPVRPGRNVGRLRGESPTSVPNRPPPGTCPLLVITSIVTDPMGGSMPDQDTVVVIYAAPFQFDRWSPGESGGTAASRAFHFRLARPGGVRGSDTTSESHEARGQPQSERLPRTPEPNVGQGPI